MIGIQSLIYRVVCLSIFDSIGQAFKYLVECYRMVIEEPKLLLPSLLSVAIGFFISIFVVIALMLFHVFGSVFFIFGGFLLVALFVSYAISYILMASTAYAVYEHVKYGKSSLNKAFSMALARAPTILMIALIAAIINVLVQSLKNPNHRRGVLAGFLATVFADAFNEGWKIASMLLIPTVVIGGYGFTDSFKKVFEIARNNLVLIGAGEVGIRVLTGIFAFVGIILSLAIAFGLFMLLDYANTMLALAVAVIFAFTALSLVSTINIFIRISYYTLIYAWAEERLEHGPETPVHAPAPLQNAFGI